MDTKIYLEARKIFSYWIQVVRVFIKNKDTDDRKWFRKILSNFSYSPRTNKKILLVQIVDDNEYALKLGAAANVIASKEDLQIGLYDVSWVSLIGWQAKYNSIYRRVKHYTYIDRFFLAFGKRIYFRLDELYHDQGFIEIQLKNILVSVKEPSDILDIYFDAIKVGDLIYDTYLRYFNKPTINIVDNEVVRVLEIALNIYYNFVRFTENYPVATLLNTYSTYIEHGITARVCLYRGIDVYTVGSYSYLLQKLEKSFPYHQINHTKFDSLRIADPADRAKAAGMLTSRFLGKIDSATSYMRRSAYEKTGTNPGLKKLFESKARNLIIYAHDFFDSPHVNRRLQFPDLYQFLKETLSKLVDLKDTNVFVKAHPNGISGCKELTEELVKGFGVSHFHLLDESVSNITIIDLRPTLIATARGTIGIEMAYFEIPTVALFDNIYSNYSFVTTCNEKESYYEYLRGERQPIPDFDKDKLFNFYYQAYLENVPENKPTVDLLKSFDGDTSDDRYIPYLKNNGIEAKLHELKAHYEWAYDKIKSGQVVAQALPEDQIQGC